MSIGLASKGLYGSGASETIVETIELPLVLTIADEALALTIDDDTVICSTAESPMVLTADDEDSVLTIDDDTVVCLVECP